MNTDPISALIETTAQNARKASLELTTLPTKIKNRFLEKLADELIVRTESIIAANKLDIKAAQSMKLSAAMTERLSLNSERIERMAEGVRQVAAGCGVAWGVVSGVAVGVV